jgi:hypothetical protein
MPSNFRGHRIRPIAPTLENLTNRPNCFTGNNHPIATLAAARLSESLRGDVRAAMRASDPGASHLGYLKVVERIRGRIGGRLGPRGLVQ